MVADRSYVDGHEVNAEIWLRLCQFFCLICDHESHPGSRPRVICALSMTALGFNKMQLSMILYANENYLTMNSCNRNFYVSSAR